jgi:hypothetical protein
MPGLPIQLVYTNPGRYAIAAMSLTQRSHAAASVCTRKGLSPGILANASPKFPGGPWVDVTALPFLRPRAAPPSAQQGPTVPAFHAKKSRAQRKDQYQDAERRLGLHYPSGPAAFVLSIKKPGRPCAMQVLAGEHRQQRPTKTVSRGG